MTEKELQEIEDRSTEKALQERYTFGISEDFDILFAEIRRLQAEVQLWRDRAAEAGWFGGDNR